MIKCKECEFFKRGKWHELQGGRPQLSGTCNILLKTLKIDNSRLFGIEKITIQDTFGCILGKPKNPTNVKTGWNDG
jgi:hypothetical protein